ncbi:PREDICTED: uncharacterized protein LOC103607191 [Galeopterus variegatus]|uniref:Uncharacterized protein LOC103607191 n=1 Tax=Galeopterus variegatus TaxID=482537 RepID=A0ABM0SAQ7_GALVR|nr:PREDICTED: uncharacterized protein LOC103607191 [Galeopterus variegatus]
MPRKLMPRKLIISEQVHSSPLVLVTIGLALLLLLLLLCPLLWLCCRRREGTPGSLRQGHPQQQEFWWPQADEGPGGASVVREGDGVPHEVLMVPAEDDAALEDSRGSQPCPSPDSECHREASTHRPVGGGTRTCSVPSSSLRPHLGHLSPEQGRVLFPAFSWLPLNAASFLSPAAAQAPMPTTSSFQGLCLATTQPPNLRSFPLRPAPGFSSFAKSPARFQIPNLSRAKRDPSPVTKGRQAPPWGAAGALCSRARLSGAAGCTFWGPHPCHRASSGPCLLSGQSGLLVQLPSPQLLPGATDVVSARGSGQSGLLVQLPSPQLLPGATDVVSVRGPEELHSLYPHEPPGHAGPLQPQRHLPSSLLGQPPPALLLPLPLPPSHMCRAALQDAAAAPSLCPDTLQDPFVTPSPIAQPLRAENPRLRGLCLLNWTRVLSFALWSKGLEYVAGSNRVCHLGD